MSAKPTPGSSSIHPDAAEAQRRGEDGLRFFRTPPVAAWPSPFGELREILGDEATKFNYSTGTVTQRNYIAKKEGLKAEFHHQYGALIVDPRAPRPPAKEFVFVQSEFYMTPDSGAVPRSLPGSSVTGTNRARTTGCTTSWAMRSPRRMVKSSSPRLTRITFTSPR